MDIEVGSKWVRDSLYHERPEALQHSMYFTGQVAEIKAVDDEYVYYYLTSIKGKERATSTCVDIPNFLKHFSPLNFSLENK